MRYLKMLGLGTLAAAALTAFAAPGTASATTLEIEGATQFKAIEFTMDLNASRRTSFQLTSGEFVSLCSETELNGSTVPDESGNFTGPTVNATLSSFSIGKCIPELEPVNVLKPGQLSVEYTENTRGTVKSSGAEITVFWKALGMDRVCKTNNTDIGTLTGAGAGKAILHVNAVLLCGPLAHDLKWVGEYEVTSPNGLGVIE